MIHAKKSNENMLANQPQESKMVSPSTESFCESDPNFLLEKYTERRSSQTVVVSSYFKPMEPDAVTVNNKEQTMHDYIRFLV